MQKEAEGLVGCSYVLLKGTEMLRNFAFWFNWKALSIFRNVLGNGELAQLAT